MQQPPDSAFENYATNPKPDLYPAGLKELKDLQADEAGWELKAEKEDVKLYTRAAPGTAIPITRGVSIVKGFTLEQLLSAIHQTTCRAVWDPRFDIGFPFERYDRSTVKFYTAQKGSGWLVSGRDFVGVSGHLKEGETYYYMQKTAEYDDVPDVKKLVRGELGVAGWIFNETPEGIKTEYIVRFDPKGSLPSTIVAVVATETPLCIARVRDYLEQHGYPPYIPQHRSFPGTIQKEWFENGGLTVYWKAAASGSFDVFYDPKKWTKGAKVVIGPQTTEEDYTVTAGEGKVTITAKEGSEGNNLRIKVQKA